MVIEYMPQLHFYQIHNNGDDNTNKNMPQLRIQSVNIWSVYNTKHPHCFTEAMYLIDYHDELGWQTTHKF